MVIIVDHSSGCGTATIQQNWTSAGAVKVEKHHLVFLLVGQVTQSGQAILKNPPRRRTFRKTTYGPDDTVPTPQGAAPAAVPADSTGVEQNNNDDGSAAEAVPDSITVDPKSKKRFKSFKPSTDLHDLP